MLLFLMMTDSTEAHTGSFKTHEVTFTALTIHDLQFTMTLFCLFLSVCLSLFIKGMLISSNLFSCKVFICK